MAELGKLHALEKPLGPETYESVRHVSGRQCEPEKSPEPETYEPETYEPETYEPETHEPAKECA